MLDACREYLPRLIELARGAYGEDERPEILAHVESCAACAGVLEEQMALSASLEAIAGESLTEMPELEARVLAEFDRAAARRRAIGWLPVMGLAAAALLGLVWVERRTPAVEPRESAVTEVTHAILPASTPSGSTAAHLIRARHRRTQPQPAPKSDGFLPIPYTIPLGPEERATIVRMEIPVAALIAAGFAVPMLDPGEMVQADVLVGQDGRARAIRPVPAGE